MAADPLEYNGASTVTYAANQVREVRRAAREALRLREDREAAHRLTLRAFEMLEDMEATEVERAELIHSLAALFRDTGDVERCEPLARRAIEAEERLGRVALVGNHRMFLAHVLVAQGRLSEAASFAQAAAEAYRAAYEPGHPELAYVSREAATIARLAAEKRARDGGAS